MQMIHAQWAIAHYLGRDGQCKTAGWRAACADGGHLVRVDVAGAGQADSACAWWSWDPGGAPSWLTCCDPPHPSLEFARAVSVDLVEVRIASDALGLLSKDQEGETSSSSWHFVYIMVTDDIRRPGKLRNTCMSCSPIVTDSVNDIEKIAVVLGYFCMQVSTALRERQMSALGCSTSSIADPSEPAAYQSSLSGAQARAPSCLCSAPKPSLLIET